MANQTRNCQLDVRVLLYRLTSREAKAQQPGWTSKVLVTANGGRCVVGKPAKGKCSTPLLVALEEITMINHDEENFVPHLWAVTERQIGEPIFLVSILGEDRFRRVDLPDGVNLLSYEQQAALVRRAAKRHFEQTRGDAGPFGNIFGYWYRHAFDQSWLISTEGEIICRNAGHVTVAQYTLSLKSGRDVTFIFRERKSDDSAI
jgi:hypothetical protein